MPDRKQWGLLLLGTGLLAMAIELNLLPLEWGRLWPLAAVALGISLLIRDGSRATAGSWSAGVVVTIAGVVLFAERMNWIAEGLFFPALLASFGLAMLLRPASVRDG